MTLYMMVTKDKYELPLLICDTPQELADKAGVKKRSLLSSLSHKNKGWARVEVEEDE